MGALVDDDPGRFGTVTALGLDEVLMVRIGPWHRQEFSTQIVDVGSGQLLDVVPGRSSAGPMAWLAEQGKEWCDQVSFATLDLSGPDRRVFTLMLPDAVQVADPFHLVKLANSKLDECRRRWARPEVPFCVPGGTTTIVWRNVRCPSGCSLPTLRSGAGKSQHPPDHTQGSILVASRPC